MFKELGAFIDAVGSTVGTTIRRVLNDDSTKPEIMTGSLVKSYDKKYLKLGSKQVIAKIDSEDGDEDNDRERVIIKID